jgi:hypothetical protein
MGGQDASVPGDVPLQNAPESTIMPSRVSGRDASRSLRLEARGRFHSVCADSRAFGSPVRHRFELHAAAVIARRQTCFVSTVSRYSPRPAGGSPARGPRGA